MDLGGKNTATMLEDADLEETAEECLAGAFLNVGQIRMGTDRIAVHTFIASKFTEALLPHLEELYKDSLELPTLSSLASNQRLARLIQSTSAPVSLQISSHKPPFQVHPSFPRSSPTFCLPHLCTAKKLCGSFVSLSTLDTDKKAIKFANSTEYGLHCAVFMRDLRRALVMAKKLEVRAAHINSVIMHDEPALPMGGVKGSGRGRFNA